MMGKEYDIEPIISNEELEKNRLETLKQDELERKLQKRFDIMTLLVLIIVYIIANIIFILIERM